MLGLYATVAIRVWVKNAIDCIVSSERAIRNCASMGVDSSFLVAIIDNCIASGGEGENESGGGGGMEMGEGEGGRRVWLPVDEAEVMDMVTALVLSQDLSFSQTLPP